MTLKAIPFPPLLTYVTFFRESLFPFFSRAPMLDEAPEDARSRREFIQEMLNRNPDAFKSEADVQNLMQMYPGQF